MLTPVASHPARSKRDAENYFSEQVKFFFDDEPGGLAPSTVVKIADGQLLVLRQGPISERALRRVIQEFDLTLQGAGEACD